MQAEAKKREKNRSPCEGRLDFYTKKETCGILCSFYIELIE